MQSWPNHQKIELSSLATQQQKEFWGSVQFHHWHFQWSNSDHKSVFNGIVNKIGDIMEVLGISLWYLHDIPMCSLQPVCLGPQFPSPVFNPGQLVHPVEWLGDYLRLHPDWPVRPRQGWNHPGLVQEGPLGRSWDLHLCVFFGHSCAFFVPK